MNIYYQWLSKIWGDYETVTLCIIKAVWEDRNTEHSNHKECYAPQTKNTTIKVGWLHGILDMRGRDGYRYIDMAIELMS